MYAPTSFREKFIRPAHNRYRHVRVLKMQQLLSPLYYRPDIIIDVSNFIEHGKVEHEKNTVSLYTFHLSRNHST